MIELTLGDRIKVIRTNKHLTQTEFGKILNPTATKSTISHWESNDFSPKDNYLQQIAKLGNITKTYLTTGKVSNKDYKFAYKAQQKLDNNNKETLTKLALKSLLADHGAKFKQLSINQKLILLNALELIKATNNNNIDTQKLTTVFSNITDYANHPNIKSKRNIKNAIEKLTI